jgi:hypothetical protein
VVVVLPAAELFRLAALPAFTKKCQLPFAAEMCVRDAVRTWRQPLQILTSQHRFAEAKPCLPSELMPLLLPPLLLLRLLMLLRQLRQLLVLVLVPLMAIALTLLGIEHPTDTPDYS